MLKRIVALCLLCFGLVALSSPVWAGSATLSSLSMPKTVPGGNSATLTVKLDAAAGSDGVEVALSTDEPEVVTIPESVTVAAKKSSATVKVVTSAVDKPVDVTITGRDGAKKQAKVTFTLTPAALAKLSLSASSVVSGSSMSATVSLDGVAGSNGVTVSIDADNRSAVEMPKEIAVPAGKKSAKFTITGDVVNEATKVAITVTDGVKTAKANLTVKPITLKTLAFSSSSVTGSNKAKLTVTLNGAALEKGVDVKLASDSEKLIELPDFVTIKPGAKSVSISVPTSSVDETVSTNVYADDGITQLTAELTVKPIQVSSLSLSPKSVSAGSTVKGTVTLTATAPFALKVMLVSDCECASVNDTVVIEEGSKSATFAVKTDSVKESTSVALTAQLGQSSKSALLTVAPIKITNVAFSSNPATSGKKVTITVTINVAAPEGGLKINVESADSSVVPNARVTIPAGATSAQVRVTIGSVKSSTKVKVTAMSESSDYSASLVVDPNS